MKQSRKKLGMCNYCETLGPVYEQEDEHRPLFLICKSCISDVFQSIEWNDVSQQIRDRHNSTFDEWMKRYRDNSAE